LGGQVRKKGWMKDGANQVPMAYHSIDEQASSSTR
jgi:hypothetical protein